MFVLLDDAAGCQQVGVSSDASFFQSHRTTGHRRVEKYVLSQGHKAPARIDNILKRMERTFSWINYMRCDVMHAMEKQQGSTSHQAAVEDAT